MAFSRSAVFLLCGAVVALLAIVAVSLQRETASGFARGAAVTTVASEPSVAAPAPFTADEEAFSEALWPLHQEVVEPAAGRLTAAGLAFALDDHDAAASARNSRRCAAVPRYPRQGRGDCRPFLAAMGT